jgi:uncharacterized protein YeaO (DUF488 family)
MSKESNQENNNTTVDGSGLSYSEWTKQVVENLVDAEKKWIELASEQNALTLKALQKGQEFYKKAPTPEVGQWAKQGLESFLEIQKKWTETVTQQRDQFLEQLKQAFPFDVSTDSATATKALTDYGKQQAEMLIDAQKRWLDQATKQNIQILEGVRKAFGLPESPLTKTINDWAHQTVNNYVEMQKHYLNYTPKFPSKG